MADEKRLAFHHELLEVCPNAYFQPPASILLTYPCIIYYKSTPNVSRANDGAYLKHSAYEVTVIDRNPEGTIPDTLLMKFPMCTVDNADYAVDNLHHTSLTIYYRQEDTMGNDEFTELATVLVGKGFTEQ